MIDSIKAFFQSMYDASIGKIVLYLTEFYVWIGGFWEVLLLLAILVIAFFIFKALKYLTLPLIITGQIVFLTAVISSMIAFVTLLATSLVAIYNRIFTLSEYLNSGGGSPCLGNMLDCLSITGVLSFYFTELFALFIVVLLIRVSSLFLWAGNFISDKVWKIGVLMGLV